MKLWNSLTNHESELISSFRLFPLASIATISSKLCCFWNQNSGILAAVKPNGPLRLYDLPGERMMKVGLIV
jgi:hypothetical protein